MQHAQTSLNPDNLVAGAKDSGVNGYGFAWTHGVYRHQRTGKYYARVDEWTRDQHGAESFRTQWYRLADGADAQTAISLLKAQPGAEYGDALRRELGDPDAD